MPQSDLASAMVMAARQLKTETAPLVFGPPVAFVYNPLDYAWAAHEQYLPLAAHTRKRVIFLGMNPGPFGMVQTGVPFGEVRSVYDWLGIHAPINKPPREHPRRPVLGWACPRSEVSGRRLWGLFAQKYGTAKKFFAHHFVANYCPLAFMDASGRNRTPDKLPLAETAPLWAACDKHLRRIVAILRPQWLIALGGFAEKRAALALADCPVRLGRILHPSPASPAANRDWASQATRQLQQLGVW